MPGEADALARGLLLGASAVCGMVIFGVVFLAVVIGIQLWRERD